MRVLIAVLMTVFLSLGTARSVFAEDGKGDVEKGKKHDGKIREEMIKKYDKDGDGKLNETERAEMKAAMKAEFEKRMLEKFDADKDGKLNDAEKAEMKKWMDEHKGQHKGLHKGEKDEKGCEPCGEKKAEDKSV